MARESPASAPMRIGGKAKQSTPVKAASKPATPKQTAAVKKVAKAASRKKGWQV